MPEVGDTEDGLCIRHTQTHTRVRSSTHASVYKSRLIHRRLPFTGEYCFCMHRWRMFACHHYWYWSNNDVLQLGRWPPAWRKVMAAYCQENLQRVEGFKIMHFPIISAITIKTVFSYFAICTHQHITIYCVDMTTRTTSYPGSDLDSSSSPIKRPLVAIVTPLIRTIYTTKSAADIQQLQLVSLKLNIKILKQP